MAGSSPAVTGKPEMLTYDQPANNCGPSPDSMPSRAPAELLEQRTQRVELLAEAGPVPCLQPVESAIIVCKRLPGPLIDRARGRSSRATRQACNRRGFPEQGGERRRQRLLHHHAVAIG